MATAVSAGEEFLGHSADWWVAVGTLALALVTLALVLVTLAMWLSEKSGRAAEAQARDEEAGERRAAEAARQEAQDELLAMQARTIAARDRTQAEMVFGMTDQRDGVVRAVTIHNGSAAPIYDVTGRIWVANAAALAPAPRWTAWESPIAKLQVIPGPLEILLPADGMPKASDWQLAVLALRFRDAGGRWWIRDREGVLHGPSDTSDDPSGHLSWTEPEGGATGFDPPGLKGAQPGE